MNCVCKFTLFVDNFNVKKGKFALSFWIQKKEHVHMTKISELLKIPQIIIPFEENKNIVDIMSVKKWFESLRTTI